MFPMNADDISAKIWEPIKYGMIPRKRVRERDSRNYSQITATKDLNAYIGNNLS